MKKNVFIAMLLAAIMVLSCMTVMVSATMIIAENGKATGDNIAYANAAVVPTIDGNASEKVWASTSTIDGITALWSDTGFYFKTGLNAEFTYADTATDTAKTISVVNGVVTGLPAGSESFAGADCVEIYAPYTFKFEWQYHGMKQYRTQGNGDPSNGLPVNWVEVADSNAASLVTWRIAQETGVRVCDFITEASDLIGNICKIGSKNVTFAGPYGYSYVLNGIEDTAHGYDYDYMNDDDSQVTGGGEFRSTLYNDITKTAADYPIMNYIDPDDNTTARMFIGFIEGTTDPTPRYGYLPLQLAYASQVTSETAPIIDGSVDKIWETTGKIYHMNKVDNLTKDAYGYISVLWSESGLYYLGVITDPNVTSDPNATEFDHCNFNVSETTTRGGEVTSFPATIAGLNAEGSYSFGIGPCGNVDGATGPFIEAATDPSYGVKIAGSVTATGYIVEAYVPYFKLTAAEAKIGHVMSLASSVDNFIPGQSGRDEYTNLGGLSSYWSNPRSQFDIVFVGEYDAEAAELTMLDVYNLVQNMLTPYLKSADAFGEADVTDIVEGYTDDLEASIDELNEAIEALQAAAADYATKADLAGIDVSAALADYAKTADVDAKIDAKIADIKVKDYTAVIVILFVLVVIEAAGIAFVFIKKK